jgi:hypothetical protein
VSAVESLRFTVALDSAGKGYRFVRTGVDGRALTVDILAPDHPPRHRSLRTRRGGDTVTVPGGYQALKRHGVITVVSSDHGEADVPVPDLLGAIILKAAAWQVDARDRERHAEDAAYLTSLVADPLAEVRRFAGSDRKRLRALDEVLGDPDAPEWRQLGPSAVDAYITWRLLVDPR